MVKIHGEGFDRQPLTLEYGGEVQEDIVHVTNFIIRTRSEPILTSSCADQSGPSIVTILDNGDQATGASYTYQVVDFTPRITDVHPTKLKQGGQRVTIEGVNFNPASLVVAIGDSVMAVTIGGRAVNVDSPANTSLVVKSPSFGDSFFDQEDCVTSPGGEDGIKLLSTAADIIVTNDDTTCQDTFTGSVLIVPTAVDECVET